MSDSCVSSSSETLTSNRSAFRQWHQQCRSQLSQGRHRAYSTRDRGSLKKRPLRLVSRFVGWHCSVTADLCPNDITAVLYSSSSSSSETFTFKSPCVSSSADSVLLGMRSRVHFETQARSAHTCRPCWNRNGLFSGTPRRPIWRHVQQERRLRARPRQRRGAAPERGHICFSVVQRQSHIETNSVACFSGPA